MPDPFVPGLLSRLPEAPRKVIVLRASRIGDFLCATPAFRALRAALPLAEIAILTLPMLRDLAGRLPFFDRYIPFPGYPGLADHLFEPRHATAFLASMQEERFDLAIQMQGSGVYSNPFTLLLGARFTAGFVRSRDDPRLLDAALPLPETGHEVRRMLALTTFLGAPARGEWTECTVLPEDERAATHLLMGCERPLIGIHPTAHSAARRWPLRRFASAARELQRRHGGSILVLGDNADRTAGAEIAGEVGVACVNLAGRTTLPVLAAIIARLSLLVTNDTGPAHIAYAMRVPTVTIFGGASPAAYGPLFPGPFRVLAHPVPCRPTGSQTCPDCHVHYACLTGITVEQVLSAASDLLARSVCGRLSRTEPHILPSWPPL